MIYNDPPHGNIDWDGAPGHAKTQLVLPIAYKVLVVPKVLDLMLLLIPVSIRNSTAPSPRVPNRCNPTQESITRHTQNHIHCVVGKSLPNNYFILAKYKSLARVGKYMAMFIATVLIMIMSVIVLTTAGNAGVIKAAITITVSTVLLAGAVALVGALVAPLAIGAITTAIGALVIYDDIKERRFLSIGILPMCLGLTFIWVAIYFYCI